MDIPMECALIPKMDCGLLSSNGSAIRRYDTRNNFTLTHEIKVPATRTTSCAFAGKNLDQLIITRFGAKQSNQHALMMGRPSSVNLDLRVLQRYFLQALN
jgi:sugar lactone lactonase YvrE